MSKENNFLFYGIILFSVLVLSVTVFLVGSNLSNSFSGMAITPSQNSGNTKSLKPSVPELQQNSGSENSVILMSDLIDNAAGIEGNPDAQVIVIEYSDFQCPFCRTWFNESKSQLNEYIEDGKVLFVYKDFPLSNIHPMAVSFAEAARCSGEQDKYFEFHDLIYSEQDKFGSNTVTQISSSDLKDWAVELNLDSDEFNSCLDSGKFSDEIQANLVEGSSFGVQGTPSFLIGKANGEPQLIRGAQPFSTFKSVIDSLLN